MNTKAALARALGLGVITGLRSMTPAAVISWAAHRQELDLQESRLAFLGEPPAAYLCTAMAFAELVADKLPAAPSRKTPGPFFGRVILGALAGAALCRAARQPAGAGALLGGLGAVAGTLGGYEARTRLVKATGGPDYAVAVIEDAVAITGAVLLVSGGA